MKILLLDNYDSFTHNLLHLIEEVCTFPVDIIKNDRISLKAVENYDKILLSPGPGLPQDAGMTHEVIRKFSPYKCILGVCLGHQAIATAFGGKLLNLPQVYHGVAPTTTVIKDDILFKNIPSSFSTGRYHSWVVDPDALPDCLEVTALDSEGNIMALRHKALDVRGVQFHPESFITEYGKEMMSNWIFKT